MYVWGGFFLLEHGRGVVWLNCVSLHEHGFEVNVHTYKPLFHSFVRVIRFEPYAVQSSSIITEGTYIMR